MDVDAKQYLCNVCLRTDRELRRIRQKFIKFHYTLCETTIDHADAHYCYECEHLIKKSYKFKQRCLQSMKLLKEYNMKLQVTPLNKLYELLPQSNIGHSNMTSNFSIKFEDMCSRDMSSNASDDIATQTPEELIGNNDIKVAIKMEPEDTELDTVEEKRKMFNVLPITNFTDNALSYDPIIAKIEGSESNIEENNQFNDSTSKISNNTSGFEVCRYKYEVSIDKTDMKKIMIDSELDIKEAADVSEDAKERIDVKEENASENGDNTIQNDRSLQEPRCGISGAIFQKISNEAPTTAYHRYRNENVTATKKTLHACSQCDYKTNRLEHLVIHRIRHSRIHSRQKLYACDKCDYRNIRKCLLIQHVRIHTKEKPFSCDQCDYKCSIKANLVRHLSTHTKEKPFACDQCDYRSSLKFMLLDHIKTHTKEKPFTCDQCGYRSNKRYNLEQHVKTHVKLFTCDQCDYKSHKQDNLIKHKISHIKKQLLACDQCDFKSRYKSRLILHLRIHTKEKPYACDQCDYRGSVNSSLTKHKKTHTREKPFCCDQCDYKSSRKDCLAQHIIRTHRKEKPFKCDQCEYRSGFQFMLRRHITIVHTKEKPFACEQCDYRSHRNADLVRHVKRHTREKPSACD